jgi:hypothetical protein
MSSDNSAPTLDAEVPRARRDSLLLALAFQFTRGHAFDDSGDKENGQRMEDNSHAPAGERPNEPQPSRGHAEIDRQQQQVDENISRDMDV